MRVRKLLSRLVIAAVLATSFTLLPPAVELAEAFTLVQSNRNVVGSKIWRSDEGMLIAYDAATRVVAVSTNGGASWTTTTLAAPVRKYSSGRNVTLTYRSSDAVWDEDANVLYIGSFWRGRGDGSEDDMSFTVYKVTYSGSFSVSQGPLRNYDYSSTSSSQGWYYYLSDLSMTLVNGVPVAVYLTSRVHTWYDQWTDSSLVVGIDPSSLATSGSTLVSRSNNGAITGVSAAPYLDGSTWKLKAWTSENYYPSKSDGSRDESYLKESTMTVTATGSITGLSTQRLDGWTCNAECTVRVGRAGGFGGQNWVHFSRGSSKYQLGFGNGAVPAPPYGYELFTDGTRHFIYEASDRTVYGQEYVSGSWRALMPWVPDAAAWSPIQNRPLEFMVRDSFDGRVYYYRADTPIADQLMPGSGSYKQRSPTLTWETPYHQTAYQVYVFNGTTQVYTSGKKAGSAQSYTIPSGVIQRDISYRIYVKTWDEENRESWHSSSIAYTWDPRSYMTIHAVEDTYISSAYPSSNYGSSSSLAAHVATSYSPPRHYETLVKFDLSLEPDPASSHFYSRILELDYTGSNPPQPPTVLAHEITDAWSESTVTWNHRPDAIYTHSAFTQNGSTIAIDLGSRRAAAYRIEIPGSVSGSFYSTESAYPERAPRLRISYSQDPNAPVIRYPDRNVTVRDQILLLWDATDPDTPTDELLFDLEYRYNGGTWIQLATSFGTDFFNWDLSAFPGGHYEVRVRADDGLTKSAWSYFPAFQIHRQQKPETTINSPVMGGVYGVGTITVGFTYSDPDFDAFKAATVEVASNSSFTTGKQSKDVSTQSTSFSLENGLWYARVRVQDVTNTWSEWSNPVVFYVDKTPPSLTLTRTSAAITKNRDVELKLTASDGISGVQSMQITTNTNSPGTAIPFQSSYTYVLPAANGQYTIYARAIDKAGNVSGWQSVVVTLDNTPPSVSRFEINDGSTRTDGAAVTLKSAVSDNSGVTGMSFSNDGVNWSPVMSYAPSFPWVLAGQVGTQTVYARFYDGAGNMVHVDDSILFLPDTTDPIVTVIVNGGETVTYTSKVSVQVAASDNATPSVDLQMRIGIGSDNWGPWVPYSSSPFEITLPAQGHNLIYVQVQDTNGNTGSVMQGIYYVVPGPGTMPPPNDQADMVFAAGDTDGTFRRLTSVTWFGEQVWVTNTTLLQIKTPVDGQQYSFTGADWVTARNTITVPVPPGPFSVWLRYRLLDQTYSDPVEYRFIYDPTPPTFRAYWENGATATTTGSARLIVEAADNLFKPADLLYQYSFDGGSTWNDMAVQEHGAAATIILGSGTGQRSVIIRVSDAAGNATVETLTIWSL